MNSTNVLTELQDIERTQQQSLEREKKLYEAQLVKELKSLKEKHHQEIRALQEYELELKEKAAAKAATEAASIAAAYESKAKKLERVHLKNKDAAVKLVLEEFLNQNVHD